jgi:hypothetical protein
LRAVIKGALGVFVFWVLFVTVVGPAQAGPYTPALEWRQEAVGSAPQARYNPAVAYDRANGEVVLFGGMTSSGGSPRNDTWTWDGESWTQETPDQSPSARGGAMMAFDPSTGEIVLAGGHSGGTAFNDTWTWDGENWTKRQDMPEGRAYGGMAWDSDNERLILFGGRNPVPEKFGQTWAWKDGSWTVLSPSNSPSPRSDMAMAKDPASGEIVLYGGEAAGNARMDDTWTWDGSNWVQKSPDTSPPGRVGSAMDFHPGLGRVVLFGGSWGAGVSDETWSWDGENWRKEQADSGPYGRAYSSIQRMANS